MQLKDLKKYKLPDSPGVYFFQKGKEVLYIGKATSLKDRVRSYFSNDLIKTRGPRLVDMITKSNKILFKETDSVLEALILESALIKKFKPIANTKEKDDKSYNSIIITDEKIPRVLMIRNKDIKNKTGKARDLKIKSIFGPFPNGSQLKEALKIIKKIFPHFDISRPVDSLNQKDIERIKLNIQIGLYPNIFDNTVSITDYKKTIRNITLFLEGKKNTLIKKLEKEMTELSKSRKFEEADRVKRTIFSLKHIKDISLISYDDVINDDEFFRIEGYDAAHLYGTNAVGVMTVIENNQIKKSDYRKFNIKQNNQFDDYASLREILERRFKHSEWRYPDLIVIDGGKQHFNLVESFIKEYKINVDIVSVVKDDKHKPKDFLGKADIIEKYKKNILLVNSEAHRFALKFQKEKRKIK